LLFDSYLLIPDRSGENGLAIATNGWYATMQPHKKRARPSTEEKHQHGEARRERDSLKKEKADKKRGDYFRRKRRRPKTEGTE
jgi:hypothetical protein